MRYLHTTYAFFAALLFSCSPNSDSDGPKISVLQGTIVFEKGYEPISDGGDELENQVSSLTGYLFNGDQLVDVLENVPTNGKKVSLQLKFEETQTTHLYFVANSTAIGIITPGSISRNDFLRLEAEKQDQLIPDYLVISGGIELVAGQNEHLVKMNRGMARLDMSVKNDLIFVKKISIIHTQKEQFLFSNLAPAQHGTANDKVTFVNLEHTFVTPLNIQQQGIGYINEQQNKELSVLVEYQYKGVDGKVSIAMPSTISRNLIYQIGLDLPDLSIPSEVVGSVDVIDWGVGTDDVATPGTNGNVKIVEKESTIPAEAELDVINRILHFSLRGGEAILAFDGKYHKRMELVTSDSRLSIVSDDTPYRGSKLMVKATQQTEGDAYSVKLKVYKDYILNDPGIEVTVNVDANKMPTVSMGGLIWMAYNGVGSDLDLYPPLRLNETMRNVYAREWKTYSGMTMWGPRLKAVPLLYPWANVKSTLPSGATLDSKATLWVPEGGYIPCPEGWRLPTYEEVRRIWAPNGLSVNETYTVNKVKYTYSTKEAGMNEFTADDKITVIKPQIFVISDGKSELIFPMVGWRRRDDYAGYKPSVALDAGKAFYLWTQNKGNRGWSAKVVGVTSDGKSFINEDDTHQAMTEAYNTIRCVKDE